MDPDTIINQVEEINNEYHFFNHITVHTLREQIKNPKAGKLSGYLISVKDAINVQGEESTAGSAILNGYKPLFDATAVSRIKEEGGLIVGKTSQDAFGFGGFNVNVGVGKQVPLNPLDKERCCGGSSGGCAGFTKKSPQKHISLAESTGGSIVCPASFCGVIGLCPTYGRVSRYGLMDYANSLDKIGPMATTIFDIALLLEVISGFDDKESTCSKEEKQEYTNFVKGSVKDMKVGILTYAMEQATPEIQEKVQGSINNLKKKGVKFEEVQLPLTKEHALSVYYLLATCEASTNLAKYCGMRYGAMEQASGKSFNDYFSEVRSKNLNDESKRRVILGTFARMSGFRDAYYIKAAKIRTLIIEEYKKIFEQYDALICPTMPIIAPRFDELARMSPLEHYKMDVLTVGPNLAGLPHITLPSGEVEGMSIGTMLIANHFDEHKLIQLGSALEE